MVQRPWSATCREAGRANLFGARALSRPAPTAPPFATGDCWDASVPRLPEKYRTVLVLCDLEGQARREAAEQLRVPEGTVASRLARARAALAKRLTRHGLAVSGAALAALLPQNGAPAGVPGALLGATM